MIEVNQKEIERYLGFQGISDIDEQTKNIIDSCVHDLQAQVTPRYTYKTFPLTWVNPVNDSGESDTGAEQLAVEFAGITVQPGNLTRNLKGCSEIVMMAATLGPAPDRLVKRAELREMFRAMVFQATGAAMVEAWVDEVNEKIKAEAFARGLYARPRFSPGYGDFPLEVQKDFERVLEMPRTIGVSLADSLLMTPTKSVTAVIGLSKSDEKCHLAGCEVCNMSATCAYSRAR